MKIIRNIVVALSMYSRIPMPIFEWKEDDMKYAIGFLGLIGVIIGAIEYGLFMLEEYYMIPTFVETLLWAVVPLVITGGFHVDGYMDVKDAFNSYKSKEEKLKILKDPHIGAFAVISLAMYGCLYLAAAYIVIDSNDIKMIGTGCIGFILMRAIGGYLSVALKLAKSEGMLHEETKRTGKITKVILIVTALLSIIGMSILSIFTTITIVIATVIFVIWFKKKCDKEFGGINGDTIGYFITESELIVMCISAVLIVIR